MKCPYCDNELEKGTSTIIAFDDPFILLSYSCDNEKEQNKGTDKQILSFTKVETYRCSNCKKIMPVFDE